MDVFLLVLLLAAIGVIIYLALKKSKVEIKYIEKDISPELRRKLEEDIKAKAAKQDQELALIKQNSLQKIIEEQQVLQQKINEERSNYQVKLQAEMDEFNKSLAAQRLIAIDNLESEIDSKKIQNLSKIQELESLIKIKEEEADAQIKLIQSAIESWQSKQNAVVESFQKLDELKNAESYHRIQFNPTEELELRELRSVIAKLRNPMPFYKAVYDIYYKNKINDLVLRVVGKGRVTGIYKITHIASGKTYVGQSVDIGNRWKQHAKRGCGADIITSNKLYPAMLEFGVENFQFEIVEVVEDQNKLGEAEKYWQNYFKSMEFGYSMK